MLIASFVCDWLLLIHCQSRSVMPNHDCINDGNNNNMYLCANMFGKLSHCMCVPWWLWSERAFAISHSDSASIWNGLINMYESKIQLIGKCVSMNAARESTSVRKIGNVISIIPYMISLNVLLNSTWRILAHSTHFHYLHVIRKPFDESISILHSFFILWIEFSRLILHFSLSFHLFMNIHLIVYVNIELREFSARIARLIAIHTQCASDIFFSPNEQLVQCTQDVGMDRISADLLSKSKQAKKMYNLRVYTLTHTHSLLSHKHSGRLIALPFYQFVIRSIERLSLQWRVNAMLILSCHCSNTQRWNKYYLRDRNFRRYVSAIEFRCQSIYRSIFSEWIFQTQFVHILFEEIVYFFQEFLIQFYSCDAICIHRFKLHRELLQ